MVFIVGKIHCSQCIDKKCKILFHEDENIDVIIFVVVVVIFLVVVVVGCGFEFHDFLFLLENGCGEKFNKCKGRHLFFLLVFNSFFL